MRENFAQSLAYVLAHEGGYVNNPYDKGGPTNRGITQRVYDDWQRSKGLKVRTVRLIETGEVTEIYRVQYWRPCRCDDLPSGVDYATFDFAINSGTGRACRFLQDVAGVAVDGKIGPRTLAAINAIPPKMLIDALCDARLDYLKHLEDFDSFGHGWDTRVKEVRAQAKAMAA